MTVNPLSILPWVILAVIAAWALFFVIAWVFCVVAGRADRDTEAMLDATLDEDGPDTWRAR